jgi:hypothetical protein
LTVSDVVDGKFVLVFAQGDVAVPPENFLESGENQACSMLFKDVDTQFATPLTAIIDLFTATGTGYTHETEWPPSPTGLCLVKLRFCLCHISYILFDR